MNKEVFLATLEQQLQGIKPSERQEALSYYLEMIEDSIEEGKTEEEVIEELGPVEEIAKKVKENSDGPYYTEVEPKKENDRIPWLLVLSPFLFVGFLLYGCLIITAYSFIFSFYAICFSCVLVGAVYLLDSVFHFGPNFAYAIFELGLSFFIFGLTYFLVCGTNFLTRQLNRGVQKSWGWLQKIVGGENK